MGRAATIGYVYDPIFLEHRTGQHPERPERLSARHCATGTQGPSRSTHTVGCHRSTASGPARVQRAGTSPARAATCRRGGATSTRTPGSARSRTVRQPWPPAGPWRRSSHPGRAGAAAFALVPPCCTTQSAPHTPSHGFLLVNHLRLAAECSLASGQAAARHRGLRRALCATATADIRRRPVPVRLVAPVPLSRARGTGARPARAAGNVHCRQYRTMRAMPRLGAAGCSRQCVRSAPADFILASPAMTPIAGIRWRDVVSHSGFRRMATLWPPLAPPIVRRASLLVLEGGYDLPALAHGWLHLLCPARVPVEACVPAECPNRRWTT